MITEEGLKKLNNLYSASTSHYFAYFDETHFPEHNLIVSLMIMTNDKDKLRLRVNNIKAKAMKDFPEIIKSGVLHFTDILNEGYDEFLKWALDQLNRIQFVILFNFVDTEDLKKSGYTTYQINNNKLNQFAGDFIKFYESKLRKENITFIFDKGFLPQNNIRKYFYIINEYEKSQSGAMFTPDVPQFQERIKENISKCVDFMVFPIERNKIYLENGIQAADFIAGALRQKLQGNQEFFDLIKDKFLQQGSSGTLKSGFKWSI